MKRTTSELARQAFAAIMLSALAVCIMIAASGGAKAADMPGQPAPVIVSACPGKEVVILYDEKGRPTPAGRTEYYYCITGTTLKPGDIPPPPEYCCH